MEQKTELNPQDFRIGNLLQRSDLDDDILTITSINKESIGYSTNYGDGTMPIDWPVGIPLTQDMLLRFGYVNNGQDIFDHPNSQVSLRIYSSGKVMTMGIGVPYREVKHVHKLQNFLYEFEDFNLTLKL